MKTGEMPLLILETSERRKGEGAVEQEDTVRLGERLPNSPDRNSPGC
jgi:hypothetical protein